MQYENESYLLYTMYINVLYITAYVLHYNIPFNVNVLN